MSRQRHDGVCGRHGERPQTDSRGIGSDRIGSARPPLASSSALDSRIELCITRRVQRQLQEVATTTRWREGEDSPPTPTLLNMLHRGSHQREYATPPRNRRSVCTFERKRMLLLPSLHDWGNRKRKCTALSRWPVHRGNAHLHRQRKGADFFNLFFGRCVAAWRD